MKLSAATLVAVVVLVAVLRAGAVHTQRLHREIGVLDQPEVDFDTQPSFSLPVDKLAAQAADEYVNMLTHGEERHDPYEEAQEQPEADDMRFESTTSGPFGAWTLSATEQKHVDLAVPKRASVKAAKAKVDAAKKKCLSASSKTTHAKNLLSTCTQKHGASACAAIKASLHAALKHQKAACIPVELLTARYNDVVSKAKTTVTYNYVKAKCTASRKKSATLSQQAKTCNKKKTLHVCRAIVHEFRNEEQVRKTWCNRLAAADKWLKNKKNPKGDSKAKAKAAAAAAAKKRKEVAAKRLERYRKLLAKRKRKQEKSKKERLKKAKARAEKALKKAKERASKAAKAKAAAAAAKAKAKKEKDKQKERALKSKAKALEKRMKKEKKQAAKAKAQAKASKLAAKQRVERLQKARERTLKSDAKKKKMKKKKEQAAEKHMKKKKQAAEKHKKRKKKQASRRKERARKRAEMLKKRHQEKIQKNKAKRKKKKKKKKKSKKKTTTTTTKTNTKVQKTKKGEKAPKLPPIDSKAYIPAVKQWLGQPKKVPIVVPDWFDTKGHRDQMRRIKATNKRRAELRAKMLGLLNKKKKPLPWPKGLKSIQVPGPMSGRFPLVQSPGSVQGVTGNLLKNPTPTGVVNRQNKPHYKGIAITVDTTTLTNVNPKTFTAVEALGLQGKLVGAKVVGDQIKLALAKAKAQGKKKKKKTTTTEKKTAKK